MPTAIYGFHELEDVEMTVRGDGRGGGEDSRITCTYPIDFNPRMLESRVSAVKGQFEQSNVLISLQVSFNLFFHPFRDSL